MEEILVALADELNNEPEPRSKLAQPKVRLEKMVGGDAWAVYVSQNTRGYTTYRYGFDLVANPNDLRITIKRQQLSRGGDPWQSCEFDMANPTGLDDLVRTIKEWARSA